MTCTVWVMNIALGERITCIGRRYEETWNGVTLRSLESRERTTLS
jgi:hypothetical protein